WTRSRSDFPINPIPLFRGIAEIVAKALQEHNRRSTRWRPPGSVCRSREEIGHDTIQAVDDCGCCSCFVAPHHELPAGAAWDHTHGDTANTGFARVDTAPRQTGPGRPAWSARGQRRPGGRPEWDAVRRQPG